MRQLIVAHDLGTSGDKASLHDAHGRLLAAHTEPYPTDFGAGGKAEQDPADWWTAFCRASRALLAETGARPDEVACVAMSGQMMGVVLVDDRDEAIRPALIWADTRAQQEAGALAERVGAERGYELLGHPIDATYSLPKMMWLRDREPESWAKTTAILLAKDYLTLRLTGRRCIDPSDATGTNAWDQAAGRWSAEMLAAAQIDPGILPEALPSATVAGGIRPAAATASGLREGTPVVVGGGDGACAALGAGLISGDPAGNATIGSSAWISIASDRPLRDPQMRVVTFDHVIPGRYVPLGAMQAAGAALDWVAITLGAPARGGLSALVEAAGAVEAAREGLFFLPYLLGERAPLWDARVRGTFVGLSRHHHPEHLVRAALEGVAFNLYGTFLALSSIGGAIEAIDAVGGGARSDVWLRIMADTWGLPVRRRTIVDEANSLGAAVVGGMAVGLIDDWSAARSLSSIESTFEPDPARHDAARGDYARFTDVYQRLRTWFRQPAQPVT
ncbi:MAG TPA: xylulokinase [Candidatus Limnocylindrales bacterium]|nr:xylulokinase [Candidatus Limnocylindrales bacterium]